MEINIKPIAIGIACGTKGNIKPINPEIKKKTPRKYMMADL
jgi:hypothetical protein